jgi:hypothetical protein
MFAYAIFVLRGKGAVSGRVDRVPMPKSFRKCRHISASFRPSFAAARQKQKQTSGWPEEKPASSAQEG